MDDEVLYDEFTLDVSVDLNLPTIEQIALENRVGSDYGIPVMFNHVRLSLVARAMCAATSIAVCDPIIVHAVCGELLLSASPWSIFGRTEVAVWTAVACDASDVRLSTAPAAIDVLAAEPGHRRQGQHLAAAWTFPFLRL